MARRVLTVTIRITGIREVIRATSKWPDDAQAEIQDASLRIADVVAGHIRTAAHTNAQSALIAPSIRVMKGNAPIIQAGGSGRVGRNNVPAYKVLFGSEFGSHALKQYRAFNSSGYWFFVTVKADTDFIGREYLAAVDATNRKWGL
jgi:hypothetical protein